MRKTKFFIFISLLLILFLLSACYPSAVAKELRACKEYDAKLGVSTCLIGVAVKVADEYPSSALKICEKEVYRVLKPSSNQDANPLLYMTEKTLQDITVNECVKAVQKN